MSGMLLAAAGYGPYMAWWKLLPLFIVTPVWLRLLTWADKDTKRAHLPREGVALGGMVAYVVAAAAYFLVPSFWISVPVLVGLFGGGVIAYLQARKSTVGLADLGKEFEDFVKSFGRKRGPEEAPKGLTVLSGKNGTLGVPDVTTPERAIYDAVQAMIAAPLKFGADRIDIRPNGEGGNVIRYQVDGVTYDAKPVARDLAAEAIALVKQMAGMDAVEVRKPQTGSIKAATDTIRNDIEVTTAGSTAGESMRLVVDLKKKYELRVDDLGLLPEQVKLIDATVQEKGGVVLLSGPEGQGLTSLSYAMLRRHDAFLAHIQTIERDPLIDLEGVRQNKMATAAPAAEEVKLISWIISQEPDVIYMNRVDDPRTAQDLIKFSESGRRAYVSLRAGSAGEAIGQWRKIVGDDTLALKELKLVINSRLIRKLCSTCKIAYTPEPDALRKMNMAPEKVTQLFQARKEPLRDPKGNPIICEACNGLGFKGRTGVYEVLQVDDEVRQAIVSGVNSKQLKALARKQKQRDVQEAALARVEAGDTSVDEVLRVIRSTATAAPPARPTPAAAQ